MNVQYLSYQEFVELSADNATKPSVILFSATQNFSYDDLSATIRAYFEKGCREYLVHGEFCDQVHDTVDDIILNHAAGVEFMTSIHRSDTADEVYSYIFSLIQVKEFSNEVPIAIVGMDARFQEEFAELAK